MWVQSLTQLRGQYQLHGQLPLASRWRNAAGHSCHLTPPTSPRYEWLPHRLLAPSLSIPASQPARGLQCASGSMQGGERQEERERNRGLRNRGLRKQEGLISFVEQQRSDPNSNPGQTFSPGKLGGERQESRELWNREEGPSSLADLQQQQQQQPAPSRNPGQTSSPGKHRGERLENRERSRALQKREQGQISSVEQQQPVPDRNPGPKSSIGKQGEGMPGDREQKQPSQKQNSTLSNAANQQVPLSGRIPGPKSTRGKQGSIAAVQAKPHAGTRQTSTAMPAAREELEPSIEALLDRVDTPDNAKWLPRLRKALVACTNTPRRPTRKGIVLVEGLADCYAVQRAANIHVFICSGSFVKNKAWHGCLQVLKSMDVPLITLLDPDLYGKDFRTFLESKLGPNLLHAFIPEHLATSTKASKRHAVGNVGVEHAEPQDILLSLDAAEPSFGMGRLEFSEDDLVAIGCASYSLEISKKSEAKERRHKLCALLGVGPCTSSSLLSNMNRYFSREQFMMAAADLRLSVETDQM